MDSTYDAPTAHYTDKLYGEFLFIDPATNKIEAQHYSTVKPIRDNLETVNNAIVTSAPVDVDRDGRVDQWDITVSIAKPKGNYVLQ